MWWALGAGIVGLTLAGGVLVHAFRIGRELGEVRRESEMLRKQISFIKQENARLRSPITTASLWMAAAISGSITALSDRVP